MQFMEILWLIAVVAFGVLEAVTFQFVCIWFAGGALGALIAALLGADAMWQSIVFVVLSIILLVCTRPFVKKLTKGEMQKTNADSLIGKKIVMTKAVDAFGENGEAKAGGTFWTVRTEDKEPLLKGDVVTVQKIEGVKLIVTK